MVRTSSVIHRYWEGPPPPLDNLARLSELYPDEQIITWGRDTLPRWVLRIIEQTEQWVFPSSRPRHAANVARVALLWRYGGQWFDHDLDLRSRPSYEGPAIASHTPSGAGTCNAWMAFPKRHPLLRDALDRTIDVEPILQSSTTASGENLLAVVLGDSVPRVHLDSERHTGVRDTSNDLPRDGWVEYVRGGSTTQERRLELRVDGRSIARTEFVVPGPLQCHVQSVLVNDDMRRRGLGTEMIELLTLKYRYFSAEPLNRPIIEMFQSRLMARDDITAWPRVARWRHGTLTRL